jgi:hypothetical protein
MSSLTSKENSTYDMMIKGPIGKFIEALATNMTKL